MKNVGVLCICPIWNILRHFGIFYGHLVYLVTIWYILPHFGMFYQEKSGNPALVDPRILD
jgi:hypothetical protein